MGMKYYAKSKKNGLSDKERGKQIKEPEEEQKTLNSHQEDIVRCAEAFFEEYGRYFSEKEKRLVIESCRIHDWGKANLVFQAMINPELAGERKLNVKSISQIPHGHLSAVTLSQNEFFAMDDSFTKDDFGAFVTAVYHHHTRKDQEDSSELRTYGKKYYLEEISDYLGQTRTKLYCSNLNQLLFHNNGYSGKFLCDPAVWNEYLLIKGLLNKFDYTVSAGYESAELACDIREKRLKKEVESFLEGKDLRFAQQFMKEHTDDNLVVIAPTGSGKTEAALLWLDGEKGFYTLPLKVSSNAIYSRIKNGYVYEHAAILHSDSMAMYLKENPGSAWEKQEQAKLLANPVTVCTIDQLFTFVYRALGTEIFAATLKYSKLIIDEIQSYDPRSIATILYGLKTIQQMGGRYAIITATFPPVLKDFMEQYGLADHCLFADFTEDPDIPIRHKVSIQYSEMYLDEIAKQGKTKKVLVICNTVSRAQEVYEKLRERNDSVWLLHSRFIRRDRNLLEQKIMEFSESDEVGIWVTTQIVEASLDIDFDILHTEMCTADSLLQRMGRCNRKGRRIPELSNIFVYDNKNGSGSIYEENLYQRSLEKLKKYEDILFSEKQKTKYMNEVYRTEAIRNTEYYRKIQDCMEKFSEIHPAEYTLSEAKVRDIKSITVIPDTIYEENQELFEEVEDRYLSKERKQEIRTKLQDLTMGINLRTCFGHPDGIDKAAIGSTDIHRTQFVYEVDCETLQGRGLLLGEKADSIFL